MKWFYHVQIWNGKRITINSDLNDGLPSKREAIDELISRLTEVRDEETDVEAGKGRQEDGDTHGHR